jgi:hypothetical protein
MGWFSKTKSDRWEREPNDLAIRIEADDVRTTWGSKPYVVYDGTEAIIFERGVLRGRLAAGEHDIDGPLRKFLRGDDPTALILVDAGDVSMDFEIEALASAEHIALAMGVRLVVRLDRPEDFYANIMKDRRRYLLGDFKALLQPEIFDALLAFTANHPIDVLYGNPELRGQAQQQLQSRLSESLGRFGFHVVAVSVTTVNSDQYDAHRERLADGEMDTREQIADRDQTRRSNEILEDRYENEADFKAARLKVLQRARENAAADRSHRTATAAELREQIAQAIHQLGLKNTLRSDELTRLEASLEADAMEFEQARAQGAEKSALDHEQELDSSRRDHGREEEAADLTAFIDARIKKAEADQQARDLDREGDEKDWDLAKKIRNDTLDARKKKKMQDVELERERMKTLSEADTATKIAMGVGDREALLELERLEKEKGMSPEQLLAKAAESSPAVAAALAERWKAEGRSGDEIADLLRRQIEEERQRNDKHSAQLERVLKASLEANSKVNAAKSQSQGPGDQTIITGNPGSPTIINPNQSKPSDEGGKNAE